jgi:hypothetical protein
MTNEMRSVLIHHAHPRRPARPHVSLSLSLSFLDARHSEAAGL